MLYKGDDLSAASIDESPGDLVTEIGEISEFLIMCEIDKRVWILKWGENWFIGGIW